MLMMKVQACVGNRLPSLKRFWAQEQNSLGDLRIWKLTVEGILKEDSAWPTHELSLELKVTQLIVVHL